MQARDAIGRTWQMSTIQYDFNMPMRFGLEYQAADGTRQRPVMIHRALFGSMERFFGVLTEHYAGAFPAWLAPVQVVGIPVTDEQVGYLRDVAVGADHQVAGVVRVEVQHGVRERSAAYDQTLSIAQPWNGAEGTLTASGGDRLVLPLDIGQPVGCPQPQEGVGLPRPLLPFVGRHTCSRDLTASTMRAIASSRATPFSWRPSR